MLWLGILFQVVGYSVLNIGAGFQKIGADQAPSIQETKFMDNVKNFLSNKPWMLGYLAIAAGTILTFFALGFGDFSILQPFMAVGIVVQALFCHYYLKEKITRKAIYSMILMIAGVILVGIASRQSTGQADFPTVINQVLRPYSLVFLISVAGIAILSFSYTRLKNYKNHASIWLSIFTGITSVFSYFLTKMLMAGLFGYGLTVELFGNIVAWVILVLMLITSTISFIMKTVAYQYGRAVLINNLFNAFNISLPVLFGVISLDEWVGVPIDLIFIQILGVVIIMGGIFLMMYAEIKGDVAICAVTSEVSKPDAESTDP